MKFKSLKLVAIIVTFICAIAIASSVYATSENMQIVKKAEKEYMIYLENHIDSAYEFAFSNDKSADKNTLTYRNSAKDLADENACHIAYIDEELYGKYFSKDAYLWARTSQGEYIAEGLKIDLKDYLTDKDIDLINTITKRIDVDTTQSYSKPAEMKDDVKVTKTVGKVVVSEKGTTEYILEKVPESGELYNFMVITEKIANGKVGDNYYSKLEASKELTNLYNNLVPDSNDKKWEKVSNGVILQPEEAKEGWKYVLWLKNTNAGEVKQDAQFLTCFEDYKPEVISEKVVTKLPVTADDPTLFIVLGVLAATAIVAIIARIFIGKKEKN